MMRSGDTSSEQASIDTNPSSLLRLLLVRELCDIDPAPEFPASPPPPAVVQDRYPRIVHDVSAIWRSHWDAAMTELAPTAPPASGAWASWPAELPQPTSEDIAAWGVTLSRPPKGTPLDQHPSRRYYLAQIDAPTLLPGRVVVLPFVGHYAGRFTTDIGYLSTTAYLDPHDASYGFQAA